eukprot:TRINITY_DN1050_c0_g1_i3.p1 TRINITY_DN1050_c0_g1~~TRINITY_DN1050_c0_g1_i3.p1  ORF type:complete len:574 (+),score=78.21 TRINITY_DN1050_c0_g1_i3:358-2079(+)
MGESCQANPDPNSIGLGILVSSSQRGSEGECEYSSPCPGSPPCSNPAWCDGQTCSCPFSEGFGFIGVRCEGIECLDGCNARGRCVDVERVDGNLPFCECEKGWSGVSCSVGECPNGCTDSEHGVCSTVEAGPPRCLCKAGYQLGPNLDCALVAECPGASGNVSCSGNGACDLFSGKCMCDHSWQGDDCSIPLCPGSPECNHHGSCVWDPQNESHTCQCREGWIGESCTIPQCPDSCNSRGVCVETLSPPRCVCNPGFYGNSCQNALDDILEYACEKTGGVPGPKCNTEPKYPLLPSAIKGAWESGHFFCGGINGECNGHGFCDKDALTCDCFPGFIHGEMQQCEYAWCKEGGVDQCGDYGFCSDTLAKPQCQCDAHVYGDLCEDISNLFKCPTSVVHGNFVECSGRYACVEGKCACDEILGIDCSLGGCALGENGFSCSNRGDCLAVGEDVNGTMWECVCDATWTGEDCSEAICAVGENGLECSGAGACRLDENNTNVCLCNDGYSGEACSPEDRGDGNDDDAAIISGIVVGVVVLAILIVLIVIVSGGFLIFLRKKKREGILKAAAKNINTL